MAVTPEGRVKKKISEYLASVPGLWYHMAVPCGFGKPTLDYTICYRGFYFAVEAKAPGKPLKPHQELVADNMRAAGGAVFIVDGTADFPLQPVKDHVAYLGTLPPP